MAAYLKAGEHKPVCPQSDAGQLSVPQFRPSDRKLSPTL